MEEYNFDLGSTEFDEQFEKIEGLSWFPWIGHNYVNSERRILVVAETHYVKGESEEIDSLKKELVDDKLTTREIVAECPVCNEWKNSMYDNLHRCLFGMSNLYGLNRDKLWNNIAFYNFVQKPMDYSKRECEAERPENNDFYDGWRVFVEIIKIIRPTECLFVGVTASNFFNQYMIEHNIEHCNVECINVMKGQAYGRKYSILVDGYNIPIIGIQHTSHHFSWESWNYFLMGNAPFMIRHLISLVLESLYNLDMIIRKDILTKLRKDGFKYYYVVNEKDIEFSEDDKQGWIKTWVTLGRLREDKQLDCVTIGCYRDNILLVETGVRKNPDMNLSDTENKEWWTKYDSKNFSVNDTVGENILTWLVNNRTFNEIYR